MASPRELEKLLALVKYTDLRKCMKIEYKYGLHPQGCKMAKQVNNYRVKVLILSCR